MSCDGMSVRYNILNIIHAHFFNMNPDFDLKYKSYGFHSLATTNCDYKVIVADLILLYSNLVYTYGEHNFW